MTECVRRKVATVLVNDIQFLGGGGCHSSVDSSVPTILYPFILRPRVRIPSSTFKFFNEVSNCLLNFHRIVNRTYVKKRQVFSHLKNDTLCEVQWLLSIGAAQCEWDLTQPYSMQASNIQATRCKIRRLCPRCVLSIGSFTQSVFSGLICRRLGHLKNIFFSVNKQPFYRGAAMAQWIHLRLLSYRPGFDSQALHLCFYHL